MATSEEIKLVIKDTAYEVAEVVCKRYEEKSSGALKLHEADCPGRSVGKGFASIIGAVMTATGAGIVLLIRHFIVSAGQQ